MTSTTCEKVANSWGRAVEKDRQRDVKDEKTLSAYLLATQALRHVAIFKYHYLGK